MSLNLKLKANKTELLPSEKIAKGENSNQDGIFSVLDILAAITPTKEAVALAQGAFGNVESTGITASPTLTTDDKNKLFAAMRARQEFRELKARNRRVGYEVEAKWPGNDSYDPLFLGDSATTNRVFRPYEALGISMPHLIERFAQEVGKDGNAGLLSSIAQWDFSLSVWRDDLEKNRPKLGDKLVAIIEETINRLIEREKERVEQELSEDEINELLDSYRFVLPTIRILYLLKGLTVPTLEISYNPYLKLASLINQKITGKVKIGDKEVDNNRFFQLLEEIVDPEERQQIQQELLAIYRASKENPISFILPNGEPNEELIVRTLVDVMMHEFTHFDIWHYTQAELEEFDEAYKEMPKGFLEFKNTIKGEEAAEKFRSKQVEQGRTTFAFPNRVSNHMYKILKRHENICDLAPIRLVQKANIELEKKGKPLLESHIHEQFGVKLTPKVEKILDKLIDRMIYFSKSTEHQHYTFSEKHLVKSEAYKYRTEVGAFQIIGRKSMSSGIPLSDLINWILNTTRNEPEVQIGNPINISANTIATIEKETGMSIEEMIEGYQSVIGDTTGIEDPIDDMLAAIKENGIESQAGSNQIEADQTLEAQCLMR